MPRIEADSTLMAIRLAGCTIKISDDCKELLIDGPAALPLGLESQIRAHKQSLIARLLEARLTKGIKILDEMEASGDTGDRYTWRFFEWNRLLMGYETADRLSLDEKVAQESAA